MAFKRDIFADLHTHSSISDGELSPEDVVIAGQTAGLKAIALTDHDTVSGLPAAVETAERIGLTFVPGAELSICFDRPFFKGTLHYLIYFSKDTLNDPGFLFDLTQTIGEGRGKKLVQKRIEKINSLFGPEGTLDSVLKQKLSIDHIDQRSLQITRRHFSNALNKNHDLNADTIILLIGNNSPAYIPSGIEINQLKQLFTKYPMVKILAHPAAGSYSLSGHYSESLPPFETVMALLPEFLECGLDGLEVFYPGHTEEHMDQLKKIAKDNQLLISGGSDFHDLKTRPIATAGVTREELDIFLAKLSSM